MMLHQGIVLLLLAAVQAIQVNVAHHFNHREYYDMRLVNEDGSFRWNTFSAVQEFGMEKDGELEITVLHADHPISFSLYTYEQWDIYRSLVFEITTMGAYDETMALTCMYPSEVRIPFDPRATNESIFTYKITSPSQYTLQIESCTPTYNFVQAHVVMKNIASDGTLSEHLGIDQLGLVPLYGIMTVVFILMTIIWTIDTIRQPKSVHAINKIFGACLLARALECSIKWWHYNQYSQNGLGNSLLSITKDVCEQITTTLFLAFLLLSYPFYHFGFGIDFKAYYFLTSILHRWSMRRRFLSSRERRLVQAVFVLYFVVAMVKATCNSGTELCQGYILTEYVIKSLMLLGIIITLNYSISKLQTKLESDHGRWSESKIPKTQARLNLFLSLRWSFLAYLLLPTVVLMLNLGVVNPPGTWRNLWVTFLIEEFATLCILFHLAISMRPIHPTTLELLTEKKED
ncbi:hypothetical protein THRCLA_06242 [Thraustotheca clavata]|uniref:GPR180/TMEM145 transmembrane domain-containing protein n=1 Tax=Thraustotheca clavata TaxID=74557 RepID=A0A1V9ZQ29_9STRA|nr:hypothetical protein THRCLA_06242 [Thraustotheca clavata]